MPDCPFCKIINGQKAAEIIFQDDQVTAFHDIRPITPVHILVVPNKHLESLNLVSQQDEPMLGHLVAVARQLALQAGLEPSGYRLVMNTGPDAGQSVFHLHLHVIGGRQMPFRFQ